MTFGEIKDLIHYGIRGEDALLGVIPSSVNSAVRDIQARRSWSFMKATLDMVFTAGTSSVELGADFKSLQPGHTPVKLEGEYPYSIRVLPTEEAVRRQDQVRWPYQQQTLFPLSDDFAWLEGTTLNFPRAFTSDVPAKVYVYQYLPKLVDDDDENYLTTDHPNAVINLAKFKVGQHSSDPEIARMLANWFQLYDQEIRQAIREDASKQTTGKSYRMGG